jgi:hypothetical protein
LQAASEVAALTLHLKETKEKLLETEAALAGSRCGTHHGFRHAAILVG